MKATIYDYKIMKGSFTKHFITIKIICLIGLLILTLKPKLSGQMESGHFVSKDHNTSVTILGPKMNETGTGCEGGCLTEIKFSDDKVPSIPIENCIGGDLTNLGDLDGDGLDEIGFLPGWFAGCWHNYRVFTYKKNKWENAVTPFPTHCNEFEATGIEPIIKDPAKPGYVLVTYSVFEADNIVFKTKSELIK